jgi:hypothetical protein
MPIGGAYLLGFYVDRLHPRILHAGVDEYEVAVFQRSQEQKSGCNHLGSGERDEFCFSRHRERVRIFVVR